MFNINQITKIKNLYNLKKSLREIAILYNTDHKTIKRYLLLSEVDLRNHKEQLSFSSISYSSNDKKFIINNYLNGKTLRWLADFFKNDPKTIKKVLKSVDVKIRSVGEAKTKFKNFNAFSIIDSEEKAYWLGFLAADGSISKGGQLTLQLAEKDLHHLTKFYNFMKGFGKISKYSTILNDKEFFGYRVGFQNHQLQNDLNNLGIIPNKTINLSLSNSIPQSLYHHYLRGLVDGDGCFYVSKRDDQKGFSLCSSKKVVDEVQKYLLSNIDLNKTKIDEKTNCAYVKYKGNLSTRKIANFLYKGATIFLERKRNTAFGIKI